MGEYTDRLQAGGVGVGAGGGAGPPCGAATGSLLAHGAGEGRGRSSDEHGDLAGGVVVAGGESVGGETAPRRGASCRRDRVMPGGAHIDAHIDAHIERERCPERDVGREMWGNGTDS